MRIHFVRMLVLLALSVPATALAQGQPTPAPPTAQAAPKTKKPAKKTAAPAPKGIKKIDITEGDEVEGGVAGATGTDVTVVGPVVHSSLLRLRTHFNDHLIRSADRL